MKTRLPLLFLCRFVIPILFSLTSAHAQTPSFWGMTYGGGNDNTGTIFKMAPDGTGLTTIKSFDYASPGRIGDEIGVQLWQSPAGKLYGVTLGGGLNAGGVLYEYDPSNGAYVVKYNFSAANGTYPVTGLTLGANGKLYGLTSYGGSSNSGVLYEYDYVVNTYTKKVDFTGTNGSLPSAGGLYLHSNGKLYGFTAFGGSNNFGVLFEYDPATNTYTKKIDFVNTNGKYPYAGLALASNGNLYGTTIQGGTNDRGTLFEYNPTSNTLTKRVDFSNANGSFPANTLVEVNSRMYGVTSSGGASSDGVLYEFNPATNAFTKKIDFTNANGTAGIGGLLKATNGKLYGLTYSGGSTNGGVLYEYDPATNTFTKKYDFIYDPSTNTSVDGASPRATLMQASNGLLFGATSLGGSEKSGVIFEYNITTNTYTKKIDFNSAPAGRYPYNGLIRASNGRLYGLTNLGGANGEGVIFELDPITSAFTTKHSFSRATGSLPAGTLVQAANGKLYGLAGTGGLNNNGVLFEYDPTTGAYSKKFDFDNPNGREPQGSMILATNNKLYGMVGEGGANNDGVIFEYDPATNVFTKKVDFQGNTTGFGAYGDLIQASNGKFYGHATQGGSGNSGVLFEYDLSTNTITPKANFNNTNGYGPEGSLLQAPNGKLYGLTRYGGVNEEGVLFEYDIATNALTKKFDFGGSASAGDEPAGSLALSPNGKLYGGTAQGGANGKGIMFEYDPATSTVTKKHDFSGADGASFLYSRLLFVKGEQVITFSALTNKTMADAPFALTATSSAALPIAYTSSNTAVATVSGNTVTVVGTGTTTITASQVGDASYNAAPNVTQTLTVSKLNQTITFGALTARNFGDAAFTLTATTTSSLPITFASSNTAVATVSGNTVTITGAGTATITASQAGNASYNAAPDVTQTLAVNKVAQTITFTAIPDKTVGDVAFGLSATASSNLPITFSTASNKIIISGTQVTIVSAGRATITAAQAGNPNFNAATSVDRSFCIKPAKPTVTLSTTNPSSPTLTSSATAGNQWFRNGTAISGATNPTFNITQAGIYKVQVQVDDCISLFSDDQSLIVTAIEPGSMDYIGIYPNPVIEELTIDLSGIEKGTSVSISTVDLLGRSMSQLVGAGGSMIKMDVRSFTAGRYIITLQQGKNSVAKSFIKSGN